MYILNITKPIKTITINEIKHFIFENYYKRIGFSQKISYNSMKYLTKKDLLSLADKLVKNIPDLRMLKNTITIIIEEKQKVKQSEIITDQPKTF